MTLTEQNTIDFGAELIARIEVDEVVFSMYANRIYHVRVKKGKQVTMRIVNQGYDFINELGGGQYHNIFEFESFSDVDPEVRDWSADDTGNKNTLSDAIVISNFAQKIMADFYLKFNKPIKPTKLFRDLKDAVKWTREQIS